MRSLVTIDTESATATECRHERRRTDSPFHRDPAAAP